MSQLKKIQNQILEAYKGIRFPTFVFNQKIDALFSEKRRILNNLEYPNPEKMKKWKGQSNYE